MTQVPSRWTRLLLTVAACGTIAASLPWLKGTRAQSSTAGGISSSPIVLDPNDQFLLVVNPDNNTLTGITVGNDNFQKLFEVPTGKEPQSVALSKDKTKAYVANAVDGTVTIHSGAGYAVVRAVRVGTEPWAIAITPNGRFAYVANSSSNTVSVINTTNDQVVRTIYNVGVQPRAIAITNDGDTDDNDEKVYVTSFLAQYRPGEIKPGADDG